MRLPRLDPKPSPEPRHAWRFEAIGTWWWIGIYEDCDIELVQAQVAERIEEFDKTYSRFRPDSLVTTISKRAGTYRFPTDAEALFALYRTLHDATEGLVTPLIGAQLSDAGYDAEYSLRPGTVRAAIEWDDAMQFTNGVLTTSQPVLLDFGAAGKGYLVDIVCELFKSLGVSRFVVDASGDMRSSLPDPLLVGMEDPADDQRAIGVIELNDRALCASAPVRRSWGDYHHVLNPRSRQSPQHLAAVWVVADTCALADGLTTALFFKEPQQLADSFTFDHALLYADGSIKSSPGLPAELFTTGDRDYA